MSTVARPTIRPEWTPHAGQHEILESDARFRVVACGRRWGKTEMCAREASRYLGEPDTLVWWVAPTYDIADIGFGAVENALPKAVINGEPKKTKPKQIELVNGSSISFRSADREDSLRGEGLDLLILDEAAMIPERAWTSELRPTLSDTMGDMIAISTPKGRSWFFRWHGRGNDTDHPDVESWQESTYENPHIEDSEIDEARQTIPDRVFRQEYLAEFIDDAGGVFPKLDECGVLVEYDWAELEGTPPYALGVDFARHQDWTVLIAIDATGRLVHFERVQGESWPQIQRRVEQAAGRYPGVCIVDASRDNKIVSDLAETGLHVVPEQFSPKRKRELIENLVTRLEAAELELPPIEQLVHELQLFEYEVTPAGNVRYNAPEGFHDDCVDALALAASKLDAIAPYAGRDVEEELSERDTGVSHL